MLKKCTGINGCGLIKPLTEFTKRSEKSLLKLKRKMKYQNICKLCANIYSAKYVKNNNILQKKKENRKTYKAGNVKNIIIQGAKSRAKIFNRTFDLTIEDIVIPEFCPIFNIPLIIQQGKSTDNSPSIDRIDNSKGYTKDNIIIISNKANLIKNSALLTEIKLIYENYFNSDVDEINENLSYNISRIFHRAKSRAKIKNIKFDISKKDIIIPKTCPILGIEIIKGDNITLPSTPTLDRIDNTKGYTKNNIRIISYRANVLKNYSSFEEYEKIYNFYKNY